jgi:hypothetical protein
VLGRWGETSEERGRMGDRETKRQRGGLIEKAARLQLTVPFVEKTMRRNFSRCSTTNQSSAKASVERAKKQEA